MEIESCIAESSISAFFICEKKFNIAENKKKMSGTIFYPQIIAQSRKLIFRGAFRYWKTMEEWSKEISNGKHSIK